MKTNGTYQRHAKRRLEILELRRLKLTIREISMLIGKSPKVVKWHLKRAKNEVSSGR